MKLSVIRIPCIDLEKSEEFYSQLLGHKTFGDASQDVIGFKLDSVQILLELEEQGEFEAGRYLGFSIEVDNIESFYHEKSQSGVTFIGGVEEQEWGGAMTHIQDPNGNSFSIVEYKS